MSYENPKITTFKDLVAWQKSHEFVVDIYELTKHFPKEEIFGLTNQLRRASVSISSNIAEGFGRRLPADRTRFYDIARASLNEVQAQIQIARDVDFIDEAMYNTIEAKSETVHKLLTGLINKTKSK